MTVTQKVLVTAILAAAIGTGIYKTTQASKARAEVQSLKQQQALLADQLEQMTREHDEAARQLASVPSDNDRLNRTTAELLKLRGEVTRLRNDVRVSTQGKIADTATDAAAKPWLVRAKQLKQYVDQNPGEKIPEFQFLTEREWLAVADAGLDTATFEKEDDYRRAMESLRSQAEGRFGNLVQLALQKYSQANNGQFPGELSQLQPYCEASVQDMLSQLYEIKPANILPESVVKDLSVRVDWVVTRKKRVNSNSTSRLALFANGNAHWQSPP
jgi:type II secretory pathway pseudopilin PulG